MNGRKQSPLLLLGCVEAEQLHLDVVGRVELELTWRERRRVVAHGTGWVERIVTDAPDTSTYFTPLAITLNIDSFEHLEFETRPDQLLEYVLVQGDERVIVEFAPIGAGGEDVSPFAPRQLEFDTSDFVQMELLGLDAHEDE